MKKIRLLIAAAVIAGAAGFVGVSSTAHASGVCNQQGFRVQIKGVWHKVVKVTTVRGTRYVNCGLAW